MKQSKKNLTPIQEKCINTTLSVKDFIEQNSLTLVKLDGAPFHQSICTPCVFDSYLGCVFDENGNLNYNFRSYCDTDYVFKQDIGKKFKKL